MPVRSKPSPPRATRPDPAPPPRQIELRPVGQLTPYARNPRTHSAAQLEQLVSSLQRFGWTNPVLIDDEGGIIAGHGRVQAAALIAERGMAIRDHADPTLVPVLRLSHLSEAERKAYVIADNQLATKAGWDEELLRAELGDLRAEGFDVNLTGFDMNDLELLYHDWSKGDSVRVASHGSNLDGIEARVIARCPQDKRAEVRDAVLRAVAGIDGVTVDA